MCTYEKECIVDGQGLEQVGKARLELHVSLVEDPDTQNIA
jgi:hypothetical protein